MNTFDDNFYTMLEDRVKKARYYKETFKTEAGQKVLEDLYSICLFGCSAYQRGSTVSETLFRNGMQQVGYIIKDYMDMDIIAEESKIEEYDAI